MRLRNTGYFHSTLPPLPEEQWPRVLPVRKRGAGYWLVRGLVLAVELVTPLSV
jgi:hypothetical protein